MMAGARYRQGGVTISLDAGLEAWARSLLSAAESETVRVIEAAAEDVAAKASVDWYGPKGVKRRTGKSGDIQTVTTLGSDEVRVGVGSPDTRVDPKSRKLLAVFVRRPSPLSLIRKQVTRAEWHAWKAAGKPVAPKIRGSKPWIIEVSNPRASDGKFLIAEHVRKPTNARMRALGPAIAQAIATKATKRGA